MPMTTFVVGTGHGGAGPELLGRPGRQRPPRGGLAPLTWAVARAAARPRRPRREAKPGSRVRRRYPGRHARSPFVIAAAVPDSYTPFTVVSVAAALLVPRRRQARRAASTTGRHRPPRSGGPRSGHRPGRDPGARLPVAPGGHLDRLPSSSSWLASPGPSARDAACGALGSGRRPDSGRSSSGGLLVVAPWLIRNARRVRDAVPRPGAREHSSSSQRGHLRLRSSGRRSPVPGAGTCSTVLGNPVAQPGTAS